MTRILCSTVFPALLFASLGCTVDFEDHVFDDDALEKEKGEGSGGTEVLSECEAFCADSATICPFGGKLGYASELECLTLCDDYSDEEMECRIVHLRFADEDPEGHCKHTLEDGGGICPDARPSPCDTFCEDSATICPFGEVTGYADAEECLSLCKGYSAEELECRLVHLVFADEDRPVHCPHTLEDGGGSCPDATR